MDDSYFALIGRDGADERYRAGPATVGPWDERLQHGGPPNALAVFLAERAIRDETGRTDLLPMRFAAEFLGPVPVGEVTARSRVLRAARSAALVEVTLTAADRICLVNRVWFVRTTDNSAIAQPLGDPVAVPEAPSRRSFDFGYGMSVEWRFVRNPAGPGPAAVWARPLIPLLAGEALSGLARVAVVADSGNGVSAELDWQEWSFVNVDLDVHLARPVQGEWVLMDAATQIGPTGSALARSTLSDVCGVVGAGLQTLVVAPLS